MKELEKRNWYYSTENIVESHHPFESDRDGVSAAVVIVSASARARDWRRPLTRNWRAVMGATVEEQCTKKNEVISMFLCRQYCCFCVFQTYELN